MPQSPLWLNAGVPATQVAEWAGHSVNVLLRVYAACVVGQDEGARQRVQQALAPRADFLRISSPSPVDGRIQPPSTGLDRTP